MDVTSRLSVLKSKEFFKFEFFFNRKKTDRGYKITEVGYTVKILLPL